MNISRMALTALWLIVILTGFPVAKASAAYLVKPFTIAVLPDTQIYAEEEENTPLVERQVQWILENAHRKNIVFVSHLGDVVDNGTDSDQWTRAMGALTPLLEQDKLPFSIVRGNHDDPASFLENFPVSLMAEKKWFAGASPSGLTQAQLFKVQGVRFLHIGFQKDPSEEDIQWANALLERKDFRRYPTIVSTRDYVVPGGRSLTGKNIWENFMKKHRMVFMVLNGHTHTEYAFFSHNDDNRPVYQMLSDYQDRDFGGNELMRLITIDPILGVIKVKTFSPYYQAEQDDDTIKVTENYFERDADSQFKYKTNIKELFAHRSDHDFGPEPPLPPPPALEPIPDTEHFSHIFQNRRPTAGTETAYEGTVDTQINENNATLDYAGEMTLTTDLDDNESRVHAMLRFDNLIGDGPGQIPPGSRITLRQDRPSRHQHHDGHHKHAPHVDPVGIKKSVWMDSTPVDENGEPTWVPFTFFDPDSEEEVTLPHTMLGGGTDADDIEAMGETDASFGCLKPAPEPFIVLDVTKSVQA